MKLRALTTGLVVAACLLLTTPAQADWEQQYEVFGNGNSLMAVAAGTGKNAVAFGQDSTGGQAKPMLLVTKDGHTWNKTSPPGDFAFMLTLSMPDEQFIYGGGLGFYKSQDGGSSFQEVSLPGGGGGPFSFISIARVQALDPVHVFAVGETNLYWTPNSLQWEVTEVTVDDVSLGALFFLNTQVGWVAGGQREEITETDWEGNETVVGYDYKNKGTVMKSTDGGKSFVPMLIAANEYFQHIVFVNEQIGWAVASSNENPYHLLKTTDSGKTWSPVALPAPPPDMEWLWLSRIVFTSPLEGWAAGAVGDPEYELENMGNKAVVIRTQDGGTSWDYVAEAEGQGGYMDIDFAGPHWGWAVGTFGHIMAFTDGTEWEPPDPDSDVSEQPEGDLVSEEDVMHWGNVLGVFGDDVLIGRNSYPGGTGGGLNVGTDDATCTTETQTTGCSAQGSSTPLAALLLLGALGLLLGLRRLRPAGRLLPLLLLALLAACTSEETVEVCTQPDLPHQATADTTADDAPTTLAPFACGLLPGQQPLAFGSSTGRSNDADDLVLFVQQHEEGGSDLFLVTPDGKETVPFTEFNDPAVQVSQPSWAPDRSAVAFVATWRAPFNDKRRNIFVMARDRSLCYQLTPGIEKARMFTAAEATATLTGSFRYGQGAIASPVSNAAVGHPGAPDLVTTGAGGEFTIQLPPGSGTLVLRGELNGQQIKGLAEYEIADGENLTLEPTIGFVEAEYQVGRLLWSNSGALLFAFVTDQLEALRAIDMGNGEMTPFMAMEEDKVVTFAPLPDDALAVVSFNSAPDQYFLYTLTAPPEMVYEFPFAGQTEASVIAVSPMRFLATVQEDRILILGANTAGELETRDVTPDNLTGLVPDQLDFSLAGASLVTTVNAKGKTNLMVVDVNSRTATAITTNGRASQPAWFGR